MNDYLQLQIPKQVLQADRVGFTCWAAALESWLSVMPESPLAWAIETQADAIREYAYFCDVPSGESFKRGFRWFAAALGMNYESFAPAAALTARYVYEKLAAKGCLYVFAAGRIVHGNGLAHASVIYGISNSETADCRVAVMDPCRSGIVPARRLREYQDAEEIIVAWLENEKSESAENQKLRRSASLAHRTK